MDDIVEWDVANWSKAVRFWEAHAEVSGGELECLELGARRGGLSLWLAHLGHRVVCSDVAGTELAARPLIDRYGLSERVTFEDIDAVAIGYSDRFDIIVFKSVLGAVGANGKAVRKREAVESMHAALRPGGKLLFAENLAASPLHRYFRNHFVRWGRSWSYVDLEEMRSLLRLFSRVEYRTIGFFGAFGRSEQQRRLLSVFDRSADVVIPERWRYIVYGIATK
jgi:SAM-dependent methyltransferase